MHLPALLVASLVAAASASAATFTVTKPADAADGTCDADCSLREAVLSANASPGPDDVILSAGTYLLTLDTPGDGTEGTLLLADDGDPGTTDDAVTLRHGTSPSAPRRRARRAPPSRNGRRRTRSRRWGRSWAPTIASCVRPVPRRSSTPRCARATPIPAFRTEVACPDDA